MVSGRICLYTYMYMHHLNIHICIIYKYVYIYMNHEYHLKKIYIYIYKCIIYIYFQLCIQIIPNDTPWKFNTSALSQPFSDPQIKGVYQKNVIFGCF